MSKSVEWVKENVLYSELAQWAVFLRMKDERTTKHDLYQAQIAYMMCASKKAKFEDFILSKDKKEDAIKLSGTEMAQMFKGILGAKETKEIENKNGD